MTTVEYRDYLELQRRIAPGLRYNQDVYREQVESLVTPDTVWLDAGCGQRIFPAWRPLEVERNIVGRAKLVIGCDIDAPALRLHQTVRLLAVADLTRLPFRSEAVDLITCNTVVEHLDDPRSVFREFARVLRPRGRVIVHTPNAWSHFVLVSRFLPRRAKLRLDERPPDEIFPTRYRANTRRRLRRLMADAGLAEQSFRYLANDATVQNVWWLAALELAWIRLTLVHGLRGLRVSMVAVFTKPGARDPERRSIEAT